METGLPGIKGTIGRAGYSVDGCRGSGFAFHFFFFPWFGFIIHKDGQFGNSFCQSFLFDFQNPILYTIS